MEAQKDDRIFNFSAGPCCLPYEVLLEAKNDLTNFNKSGMSVMEMSHRGKEFISIYNQTLMDLRDVLGVPQNYKLLFQQGGGTAQFSGVPLNLLPETNGKADFAVTGVWSEKAYKECTKYGSAHKVCDTKESQYTHIPDQSKWDVRDDATYLYYCDNETVHGVEFADTPLKDSKIPLVSDMSSNFCTRPIDIKRHDLIFAGAQKNVGPAGLAVVIVREDLLGKEMKTCPTFMSYKITADNDSMYNTPPCWSIYITGLMARYIKQSGGLEFWKQKSTQKAGMLYDVIDNSCGFYTCAVTPNCRSNVNVRFTLKPELEKTFLSEASDLGMKQLAGHRSLGGVRASIYNGMPDLGVSTLTDFMKDFQERNSE